MPDTRRLHTVPAALLLTTLLTLVAIAFPFLAARLPNLGLHRRTAELPIWLLLVQVMGMVLVVVLRGWPRSIRGTVLLLLMNAWLLGIYWLAWEGQLRETVLWSLDASLRLLLAAGWCFAVLGVVGLAVWVGRNRRQRGAAPNWLKAWFAALVLLGTLEAGMQLVDRLTIARETLAFPREWEPAAGEEIRIAAVGGSTMLGFPYHPKFDIPASFTARLKQRFPRGTFRFENAADGGLNFERAVERLHSLSVKPDLILVYTGHNEFFYDLEEAVLTAKSSLPLVDRWFAWSAAYRHLTSHSLRLRPPPATIVDAHQIVQEPLFSPGVIQQRRERLADQLQQFADFCRDEEIALVGFLPAAGESVFEPNRSLTDRRVSEQTKRTIQQELGLAGDLQAREEFQGAIDLYRQLIEQFPGLAEIHFRLGECQSALGQYREAQRSFQLAIDLDGYPCRATSRMREAIRDVMERNQIPCVDAEEILRPLTKQGILDRSAIHDNVHPTLAGHLALGQSAADLPEVHQWASRLLGQRLSASVDGAPLDKSSPSASNGDLLAPLELADVIRETGFEIEDLATAYERTAWCLEHLSLLRLKAERRFREAAQYRRWAERLLSGEIQPGEEGTESLSSSEPPGVVLPEPEGSQARNSVHGGAEPTSSITP
jgi:tetratricopeptide (TPR) repeat protein